MDIPTETTSDSCIPCFKIHINVNAEIYFLNFTFSYIYYSYINSLLEEYSFESYTFYGVRFTGIPNRPVLNIDTSTDAPALI